MRAILISVALLASLPALADDKTDAMTPIHQFLDRMNANDMKSAAAAYAPTASIIDEFPPHHWQGPTAFADWGRDFEIDSKKNDVSDPNVTLGAPKHIDVTGDRAYVVAPATYSFKQHGKQMSETGSTMTFALQKLTGGWRIVGWAWSAH
jgi:hypothetical protein